MLLLGGKVATDAAFGKGRFAWDLEGYALAAGAFVVAYFVLNQARWSPHVLYLARLRSTFATKQSTGSRSYCGVAPRRYREEGTWDDYRERSDAVGCLPELLVCAAAQRNHDDVTGIPAISFVFSAEEIVMVDDRVDENGAIHSDRYSVSTGGYKHTTPRRLATPSGAAAVSGAAFTSAMGRHSYGTTNALLAALNLRLGVWMPNPRYVLEDQQRFKRPRLGYLVKELFGRYDLADPYLYVTDGGHWENLGLVELVRRRCKWITCVDASGDRVGSFGTLREAVTLARVACHADIEIDYDELRVDPATELYRDCVALGVIRYHNAPDHGPTRACTPQECPPGVLVYIKSQVSPYAPLAVQAYALQDRTFPNYPTFDQFLAEAQFDRLVLLARAGAQRACERRQRLVDALDSDGSCPDEHIAKVARRLRALGFCDPLT